MDKLFEWFNNISWISWVAWVVLGLYLVPFLAVPLGALYAAVRLPELRKTTLLDMGEWPLLSVVVVACNEEKGIEKALESLRGADYPNLEFIWVNDRSQDGTGEVMERLAENDERIRVIHIEELPAGWLGKVHAVQVGTKAARGEWILQTDADVVHRPSAWKKAVSYAIGNQCDMVTVMPRLIAPTWWVSVAEHAFTMFLSAGARMWKINDEKSDVYFGAGAFLLYSNEALAKTKGFDWLRMEVADDVGVALMFKSAGLKIAALSGNDELEVTWYESLPQLVRGLEKNTFGTATGYRLYRLLPMVTGLGGMTVLPCCVFLFGSGTMMWLSGAVILLGLLFSCYLAVKNRFRFHVGAALILGAPVLLWVLLHSAWKTVRQKGIVWRGTFYPMDELRRLQRVSNSDALKPFRVRAEA